MRPLVIIPAYNEERGIGNVIEGVRRDIPEADILVVDDGSGDQTAHKARSAGAAVARHPFNLGYGAALQTGYRYAMRNGYSLLVQMDGDGQHDPSCIPALLEPLRQGRADVAIGSRFLASVKGQAPAAQYDVPLARRMGISLFRTITALIIGQRVTDPTSGFQAMQQAVFSWFTGDKFPADYPDADVIIMLHRAGFRIVEVPVRMFQNPDKKSMHSGLKPLYYVFKMFLSIFVTLMRR
jgi:glycosyltransferase involved in cell wall biosynthesis